MSISSTRVMRTQRLLDVSLQLSIPLSMCATLLFLTAVYIATFAWFGGDAIGEDSRGFQRLALVVTGAYLLVSLAATFAVGVLVTHRIAGPIRVIQSALGGMRVGDFGRRLVLRRRDHLQPLAAEVSALREELLAERESRRAALGRLETALSRGDLDQARGMTSSLLDELAPSGTGGERLTHTTEQRVAC
jgi:hypothetical protein